MMPWFSLACAACSRPPNGAGAAAAGAAFGSSASSQPDPLLIIVAWCLLLVPTALFLVVLEWWSRRRQLAHINHLERARRTIRCTQCHVAPPDHLLPLALTRFTPDSPGPHPLAHTCYEAPDGPTTRHCPFKLAPTP